MPGESSRTIQYRKPPQEAFEDVVTAFRKIGSVEEASDMTMTVTGKTRFGLQAVKLRVSICDRGESSSAIEIQAFADDLWGGGARKGTDKLITALQSLRARPGRSEERRTGSTKPVTSNATTRGRSRFSRRQTSSSGAIWILLAVALIVIGAFIIKWQRKNSSGGEVNSGEPAGVPTEAVQAMVKLERAFGSQCRGASQRDIRNITFVVVSTYPEDQILDVLDDLVEVQSREHNALSRLAAQKDTINQIGAYYAALTTVNNVSGKAAETYLRVYGKFGILEQKAKSNGTTLDAAIAKIYSK